MTNQRFYVQPPVGKAKSGYFCWWVVEDRNVDLAKHGNNITDYFYDGYPDAQKKAEARAAELNANPASVKLRPVNHPDQSTDAGMAEFLALYNAAPKVAA